MVQRQDSRTLSMSGEQDNLYLGGSEHDAETASDSDDVNRYIPGRKSGLTVTLLASALVLSVVGAANTYWPVAVDKPSPPALAEASPSSERLLESDELLRTTVKHSMAFYDDYAQDDKLADLSAEEYDEVHQLLMKAAVEEVKRFAGTVAEKDAEASRQLQDLDISSEEWEKTHALLSALHDERTREIGEFVMTAVNDAGGRHDLARNLVNERLGGRSDELRTLKDELIPKELHMSGLRNLDVVVDATGGVEVQGSVGSWDASINVDSPQAVVAGRRLLVNHIVSLVVGTIGLVVTTIISIITTVLTIISAKAGARLFWVAQGVMDGGVCLATLDSMKPWKHWLPCIVSSVFLGLEAIWTWTKK